MVQVASSHYFQWIFLRENLQEAIDFPIKYGIFTDLSQYGHQDVLLSEVSADFVTAHDGSTAFTREDDD